MPDPAQAIYLPLDEQTFDSTPWTRGPWNSDHQHGGPPAALMARALEATAAGIGLPQVVRVTTSLLRPVPIAPLVVATSIENSGRRTATLTGTITADGVEVVRATALALRSDEVPLPEEGPHRESPRQPPPPDGCKPFKGLVLTDEASYNRAVECRLAAGAVLQGPTTVWFRLQLPLVLGEDPSPLQRALAAADYGNGISPVLDFFRYIFINPDLTAHLFRAPVGEWIALESRTDVGPLGAGVSSSRLFDTTGMFGTALQSLLIDTRDR
jgi:hypothetical protein